MMDTAPRLRRGTRSSTAVDPPEKGEASNSRSSPEGKTLTIGDPIPRFEVFYAENYRRLVAALQIATGSRIDADDLAQEAFVRVYERWERVSMMKQPEGYLFKVAYRLGRRRKLRQREIPVDLPASASTQTRASEDYIDLLKALSHLKASDRRLLVFSAWLDLSADELGRLLGVRPGTVRVRLHRARKQLGVEIGGSNEQAE